MKKELPKVFQNSIDKTIHNNEEVFYGNSEDRSSNEIKTTQDVDELFKPNEIYRTNVKIKTNNGIISAKIIGRSNQNLITSNNELIPINDILTIEVID